MSERTCPLDGPNPPPSHKPCPDCGATWNESCPLKIRDAVTARDRLAAENARLREALAGVLEMYANAGAAYIAATGNKPTGWHDRGWWLNQRDAWLAARVKGARALLETPDA